MDVLPAEFTAVDVETATWAPESICQVGVARVRQGVVVEKACWLVRPPGNEYYGKNIAIHGITPDMTKDAPGFGALWPQLAPYVEGRVLAAHYAIFDMPALTAAAWLSGITLRADGVLDSCLAARRAFPRLENHKLPTVCGHLDIALRHHDAGEDALACAKILIAVGASPCLALGEACDRREYGRHFWRRG